MRNLKSKVKNMKGITLISLVVTVIVLIILAGISVNLLLGENGLINKTKLAKEENDKATAKETMNLKITNVQILKYAQEQRMPTLKELADNFCEDDDFQYVQETSEVASLTKITNNNPTSIYTKLKAYPYEFEINSSLQLASIDGVQVATSEVPTGYVSQSDYNALLARVVALENNSNSQAGSSTSTINYSTTEEQVVGTWIDGSPIYQITIDLGSNVSISGQSWYSTSRNSSDADIIINALGSRPGNESGLFIPLMASTNDHTYFEIKGTNTATVRYVTLQYTKTTQTPTE